MHFLGKSPLSYNLFISIDLVIRRVLSVMRCVFVVLFKEAEPKKKKKKVFGFIGDGNYGADSVQRTATHREL